MKRLTIGRFLEPDNGCAEALNSLCANISSCGGDMKTLLITSRYAAEGKTFLAMNLMRALARAQKRVVLLEADLRGTSISRKYHLEYEDDSRAGFAQFLAGACDFGSVLYETNIPNAYMIPAGKQSVNPLQLMSSHRLCELIEKLKADFDIVLVDSAAAGTYAEVIELARHCDGALMVVAYRIGSQKDIISVSGQLARADCEVMGIVMNNVKFDSFSSRRHFRAERKVLQSLERG